MAVLVKNPERVRAVVNHIVKHFQTKVEPNGFKAQVVTFDRECCVLYKAVMDELIGPEASAVVMISQAGDPPEWKKHARSKDEEEKLLDRFRDPADPLQFVIVTSKLLTGFDAPILQVMYLDKPMKDHNLLQAICRTNRTFGQEKTHGLIVDYIGIFDDVARALSFDEKAVQQVVSNIEELRRALPLQVQKCLTFFPGVDRTVGGYEGLMAAQQCLPNNEVRDKFAAQYSVLGIIWEALSPDPCLSPYETDYRWLTQVYESVKPPSGNGKLLWHALGAKTVDLINQNVHVESVRDDVETLVMDAQVLEDILKDELGYSVHRAQMFMWTVILGVIFVTSVIRFQQIPQLDESLLALMGISSGAYVGLKTMENKTGSEPKAKKKKEADTSKATEDQ